MVTVFHGLKKPERSGCLCHIPFRIDRHAGRKTLHMADHPRHFRPVQKAGPAVFLKGRDETEAFQGSGLCVELHFHQAGILCFGIKKEISHAVNHRGVADPFDSLQDMGMIPDDQVRPRLRD